MVRCVKKTGCVLLLLLFNQWCPIQTSHKWLPDRIYGRHPGHPTEPRDIIIDRVTCEPPPKIKRQKHPDEKKLFKLFPITFHPVIHTSGTSLFLFTWPCVAQDLLYFWKNMRASKFQSCSECCVSRAQSVALSDGSE